MKALLLATLLLAGCLSTTPEEEVRESLGPEERGVEEGPFHRPGQPCLACHGEETLAHDAPTFVLAGTVYETADSVFGLRSVDVHIADSAGHSLIARTNRVGSFFLKEEPEDEGGTPESDSDGEVELPYRLVFPLRVMISYGAEMQIMESAIEREGSCGYCHKPEPGARSNGRIYVRDLP